MASCSLCISNERLCAVIGTAAPKRINVKSFASAALPEGALINGVITDARLVAETLQALGDKLPKNALHDIRLALRSSQIFVKRAAVPALSQRKMREWTAGAFSDVVGSDDMFYDYMILERDKTTGGQAALLCAAQQQLVGDLCRFFEEQALSIASIDTLLSAHIKLARRLRETRAGTFILLNMDGQSMDAALFVSGSFRYGNSVRLLSERGTAESAAEISRQVSSIIQFNTSERSGQSITNVYAVGLREGEDKLFAALQNAYGLTAGPLTDADGCVGSTKETPLTLNEYSGAVGNLIEW